VSDVEGVGLAESFSCFLSWRFSLRLKGIVGKLNAIAESASLSSGSGSAVEVCGNSGSAAGVCGGTVGLATCARVGALDMTPVFGF
jgi:hypothetical protein